jgi:SAM-dependent methyltransferase
MNDWYLDYFDDEYLRLYAPHLRTERNEAEVEGVIRALELEPGAEILDLACGQGRHAVPLAQRGYRVTGLDLSPVLLRHAREHAEEAGVEIEFRQGDMREIPWTGRFDAVINLFTAFGYFEDNAENQKVLVAIYRALKPGGKVLMEMNHRDWLMRVFKAKDWETLEDGSLVWYERQFDPISGINTQRTMDLTPDGQMRKRGHAVHVYTATELTRMLRQAGLEPIAYYGGLDLRPFGVDTRMAVAAQKPRT